MIKRNNLIKTYFLLIGDAVLLYAALCISLAFRYWGNPKFYQIVNLHLTPFTFVFTIWVLMFGSSGLYDLKLTKNNKIFLYRLLRTMVLNIILAVLVFYIFPFKLEPRRNLLLIGSLSTIFIFSWRYLSNVLIIKTGSSRVIFLGINQETVELAEYLLKNPQLGQKPVAFITNDYDEKFGRLSSLPYYNLKQDIADIIGNTKADTVVITSDIKDNKPLVKNLFQAVSSGVLIIEFHPFYEMLTGKVSLHLVEESWFIENLIGLKKTAYDFLKRILDIFISIILGVPILVSYPIIAVFIKMEAPGPVFFRQRRVGKNGRVFELIKYRSTFRTSVKEYDGWEKEDESYIYTKTGKFLRKTYLDELPQIINIIKGEMSFVGPRPERIEFVQKLEKDIPFYRMRLLAKPGITGWAQINMENDASAKDASEKMQYDLYYIKNRALMLDLVIALRTINSLLRREGR